MPGGPFKVRLAFSSTKKTKAPPLREREFAPPAPQFIGQIQDLNYSLT
jgi:hypothetical protein